MDTQKDNVFDIIKKISDEGYQEGYAKAKGTEKATQAFSFLQYKCIDEFISKEYIKRRQKEEAAMMIGNYIIDNNLCEIIDNYEINKDRHVRKIIVEVVRPDISVFKKNNNDG